MEIIRKIHFQKKYTIFLVQIKTAGRLSPSIGVQTFRGGRQAPKVLWGRKNSGKAPTNGKTAQKGRRRPCQ